MMVRHLKEALKTEEFTAARHIVSKNFVKGVLLKD